jgi:hypothetical protein
VRIAAIASVIILAPLWGWGSALAQAGGQQEAPVGHRQPTANSVQRPQEKMSADKKLEELDKALDKKLKSICRGC